MHCAAMLKRRGPYRLAENFKGYVVESDRI
jgi:hypothetical protein